MPTATLLLFELVFTVIKVGSSRSDKQVCVCVYVCVVITFSRLGINQVWLPILLVVS